MWRVLSIVLEVLDEHVSAVAFRYGYCGLLSPDRVRCVYVTDKRPCVTLFTCPKPQQYDYASSRDVVRHPPSVYQGDVNAPEPASKVRRAGWRIVVIAVIYNFAILLEKSQNTPS